VKTEEFSFRFLLSDRDAITGDARSERPAGRIFPDHRRLKGGGKLLGKTDSEQARSSHPGYPGAENETFHRSTSEIPPPVALLLVRLVCFQAR